MVADVSFLMGGIAVQAVPRLSQKLGIELNLPLERMLYGLELGDLISTINGYDQILKTIIAEHDITWREVYEASDVGRERLALANKIDPKKEDIILDVGCGKGYTTASLAFFSNMVCGLDLMNGLGRFGWWTNFTIAMASLGLHDKTMGVRSSATEIPYRDGAFSLTVSVHALRNFESKLTIVNALTEMKRVTQKKGRVIVAENLPVAFSKSQEAHLKYFRLKTRFVELDSPYCSEDMLLNMFEEADLEIARREIIDFDLSAAPPFFYLDPEKVPSEERTAIVKEYSETCKMVREYGEKSPPVLLLEAHL
jgi:ubiquinone/menaquinone biosynthesis C-methylase UbiE